MGHIGSPRMITVIPLPSAGDQINGGFMGGFASVAEGAVIYSVKKEISESF